MKKRVIALFFALSVFVTTPVAALQNVHATESIATGTTYYISSLHGDNSNSGTSADKAWQTLDKLESVVGTLKPGDQILLEKGSVFHGYIHLKDVHGTQENPITISSYGEGNKPIINGDGQGIWYQDYGKALDNANHRSKGYVSSSILLYDVDYVTISDLEITNQADNVENFLDNEKYFVIADKMADRMDRTGVAGIAKDGGTMQGITLSDLYIHDVDGNIQDKHMNNGGIQMNALMPKNETTTGIARYQDVLIENCFVENVSRAGIIVGYTYQSDKFGGAAISDEAVKTYGHGNIVFRNNYVKDAGNDAIVVMYADRPLIENNVSDGAGADLKKYSDFWQPFCAAIWPWKCKDAIFQGNEAFDTVVSQDGQAWDIDSSDGTIYQYNYSHNNGGGALLVCYPEAYNGTFRYNISYNDLRGLIALSNNPEAKIYNNVFYIGGDLSTRIHDPKHNGGVGYFANNIFYNESSANPNDNWQPTANAVFSNNLYYGYDSVPSSDKAAVVVEDGNAVFADKNALAVTMKADGSVNDKSAFAGYQLAENSPAINAGVFITEGKDFFGNTIGNIPDIGIYETDTANEGVVLKLTSDVYTVTATDISGVKKTETVAEVLANLKYAEEITCKITDASGAEKAGDAKVADGDKIVISYEERTKTYTISIPRAYAEYEATGMTAVAGSDEGEVAGTTTNKDVEGPARLVLDNNTATIWHSKWDGDAYDNLWITIDMAAEKNVSMLKYVPRLGVNNGDTDGDLTEDNANGVIKEYKIYTSSDNQTWEEVTYLNGNTWLGNGDTKHAYFETVNARYVRLQAVSSISKTQNDDGTWKNFASAAEIRVGYELGEEE